jgi:hypothetical protein
MVRYVADRTGRFAQRPHFEPKELDRECEQIVTTFLKSRYGEARFPISTEDLTLLLERHVDGLDQYADLSAYGADVEGVTEFNPGKKPYVRIADKLSSDARRENRLRTTLTHEFGHVHFHGYLWSAEPERIDLLAAAKGPARHNCRRHDMLNASQTDWMEWQAGYVSGALLMPISYVRKVIAQYQDQHGLFGSMRLGGEHGLDAVRLVMQEFQVSEEAATIRLLKLGILGDSDSAPSLFDN